MNIKPTDYEMETYDGRFREAVASRAIPTSLKVHIEQMRDKESWVQDRHVHWTDAHALGLLREKITQLLVDEEILKMSIESEKASRLFRAGNFK